MSVMKESFNTRPQAYRCSKLQLTIGYTSVS